MVAAARSTISAHRRVLLGDRLALAVAERVHVQQQRLLDLGAVEQVAAALRAPAAGGRAARSRRPSTVSSSGVASTGKVFTLLQLGVLERRHGTGRRARSRPRGWRAGWPRSASARSASRRSSSGVRVVHAHPHARPGRRACGSTRSRTRPSRPPKANGRPPRPASGELEPRARWPGGARRRPAGSAPWPTRRAPVVRLQRAVHAQVVVRRRACARRRRAGRRCRTAWAWRSWWRPGV